MTRSRAAVLTGKESLELREFDLPRIGDDDALLRLEACGMCGTDLDYYFGKKAPGPHEHPDFSYPFIPGHEPVGIIEAIGGDASKRWGVKSGDRVAVQYYTCGTCEACTSGRQESCQSPPAGLGKAGIAKAPSLWGGYSEFMYIPPRAHVFPFSRPELPAHVSALFNAFAGAFAWTVLRSGLQPGQSVAIFGPGQRGLASIVAAKESGASFIAAIGRGRNPYKLQLAKDLGADLVVNLEEQDPVEAVMNATGKGVDIAVDITPAPETFEQALGVIKRGGIVVEAGLKRGATLDAWCPDILVNKNATVMGAYGVSPAAVRAAIALVESGKYPVERLVSHTFPLDQAGEALETLAGRFPDRKAMNVILIPPRGE